MTVVWYTNFKSGLETY